MVSDKIVAESKTSKVTKYLEVAARQMGPGGRFPSMQELALQLGVSVMTMNRALSELEARGLVIRRQGAGTFVTDKIAPATVAVVYDRDVFAPGSSPFGSLLLHHLEHLTAARGQQLELFLSGREPTSANPGEAVWVPDGLVEGLQQNRFRGLIFAGESRPRALPWLLEQEAPVVTLSYAPIAPLRVALHHAHGVGLGTAALLGEGSRRPALLIPAGVGIGPAPGKKTFPELTAFTQALQASGLTFQPDQIWQLGHLSALPPETPGDNNWQQGYAAAHTMFKQAASPDGVIILDDMMTRGALAAWDEMGLLPGREFPVASHCNRGSTVLLGWEDRLHRMEFDPGQISAALLDLMPNPGQPARPRVSWIKPSWIPPGRLSAA